MGGGEETKCNRITFIFSKERHEDILSMHLTNFVNQKNEKIKNGTLLMKIISSVSKILFFKTSDLYPAYLFSEYTDN